jgi:uncharacterized protein
MTAVALANQNDDDALIERLCSGSQLHHLWRTIGDRGRRVTRFFELGAEPPAAFSEARVERLSQRLMRYITKREPGCDAESAMVDLRSASARFNPAEQARLCVLLERGSDPVRAVGDIELCHLFNPEEIELLAELKRAHPKRTRHLSMSWNKGADVKYGSYVCAIVKLTRQCNLRCVYCIDWRTGPETRMPFSVLAHTISKLLRAHTVIDFICHGGEATLLKRRAFLRILGVQQYLHGPGQLIRNQLQTNGTLIDRDWADFFADFNFDVSISLDGPAQVHACSRPMANGKSSYDLVRRGIRLLRERGLGQSVLVVVGEPLVELGAETLLDFLHEERLLSVGMLAVRPGNPPRADGQYVSIPRYMSFLIDLQRARRARPDPWVAVREIDELAEVVGGAFPKHCELLGNCVGNYFSVEADGSVGHCDKFIGDARYTFGNILEADFQSLRANAASCRIRQSADASADRMHDCPHYAICRGWCPHERYVAQATGLGVKPKCCGLSPLIEELARPKSIP